MGDLNQFTFICDRREQFTGPFLEVGSKDYGTTQDLRSQFTGRGEYVGLDMQEGPGVDLVLDLTVDFDQIDARLDGRRFGTIFCLSVLEHCDNPFAMAANLTKLLKPDGWLCLSVPFAWQIHGYPNDYWRFTPEGVKKLFPDIEFDMQQSRSATYRPGEFAALDDDLGKISFSFSKNRAKGHTMRGICVKFLKSLSRIGILSWIFGHRHVFAPTGVLMIGKPRNS